MDVSFDDLYELFYVVSYGFNCRCKKEIQEVFYAYNQDSPFLFYEFFLSQPIPKSPIQDNKWGTGWEESVYVIAPFAPRMAEHATLVPRIPEDGAEEVKNDYRTPDILQKLKLFFPWKNSELTKDAWTYWGTKDEDKKNYKYDHVIDIKVDWDEIDDGTTGDSYPIGLVRKWNFFKQTRYLRSNKSARALLELYRPLLKSFKKDKDIVPCVFVPIASANLFYGGIWIMLPGLKGDKDKIDGFSNAVGLSVAKLINRSYLPALAVLHEHWLESIVYDHHNKNEKTGVAFKVMGNKNMEFSMATENINNAKYRNPFCKLPKSKKSEQNSLEIVHEMEWLFERLWEKRIGINEFDELKDNLIFRSYLVCSEVMAQLLLSVIKSAKTLSKSNANLPACLVVGGAGSGKEKLAHMLRLFSEHYWKGRKYVINMASIRPAPLTSALMVGVEASWSKKSGDTTAYEFCGLLQHINKKPESKEKSESEPPTVILDEFNSMDSDSQGVLLRFLDNSEIVPLGAIETKIPAEDIDCLVVGIMNEDPDDISRERAMEFFRRGEYLGSFLGDLMYEHFLRIRRLRPDIMYRMIRNGKFIIPDLRERGEDIPMLFRVFVRSELERIFSNSLPKIHFPSNGLPKIHFPLDMLDRLTAPDLLWPGNVRQLQALAKVVADCLSAKALISPNDYHIVKLPILEKALRQVGLVKNQMFERTALTPTIRK